MPCLPQGKPAASSTVLGLGPSLPSHSSLLSENCEVALEHVRTGPAVQNVLYAVAGEHGVTWSLWQKTSGETRGQPLGFWSQRSQGSEEANYTPTEKEILAA